MRLTQIHEDGQSAERIPADQKPFAVNLRPKKTAPAANTAKKPQLAPAQPATDAPSKAGEPFVKRLQTVLRKNAVYLFGRAPDAELAIPNIDRLSAQVERAFTKQSGDRKSMEQQYEELRDKVELIAGKRSHNTKSLIVTGAPSAGKTFNIMETIKKVLNLVEGKDYMVMGGAAGEAGVYRALIEQVNGLIIFDDCDSIMDTQDGRNLMKKALDSTEVREVDRNKVGYLKMTGLTFEEREDYVDALSNVLRNEFTEDDYETIVTTLHRLGMIPRILRNFRKEQRMEKDTSPDFVSSAGSSQDVILDYARNNLPNKFDFRGRIIFISNRRKDEWDGAILTRAFHQDMEFYSDEMLDFIEQIRGKMSAPGLSDEQKLEVIEYLRKVHDSGELTTPINFRIVLQAWDLRQTPNWKSQVLDL